MRIAIISWFITAGWSAEMEGLSGQMLDIDICFRNHSRSDQFIDSIRGLVEGSLKTEIKGRNPILESSSILQTANASDAKAEPMILSFTLPLIQSESTPSIPTSMRQDIGDVFWKASEISSEEPFIYEDSSIRLYSKLGQILKSDQYSNIFKNSSFEKGMNSYSGKLTLDSIPSFFPGIVSRHTGRNCYIIQMEKSIKPEVFAGIKTILNKAGADFRHEYNMTDAFKGVTVCFPKNELPLSFLQSIQGIARIERDQYASSHYVQEHAPWQLTRLNNPAEVIGEQTNYLFNATGKGVNVYVIDSGAMIDHPDFGGRAKIGFSVFHDFPNDCAGHGTQVSSVIAGTNIGVAKMANIIVAQVLDCDGQGENSAVMAALNWIVANHVKPAVINMSVGGPKSPAVDEAVKAAISQGIGVVVAAGNSAIDSCVLSPSGVESAMVVGASTVEQKRASFSNFGSCLDIFAPGKQVIAAATESQATKNGFVFASGTSMSAPLVTGVYALLLEANPSFTPAELKSKILALAVRGLLDESTLIGSPNLLLQAPSLPETPNLSITFLKPGVLPTLGMPEANSQLEFILIIICAVIAGIFALGATIFLIYTWLKSRKNEWKSSFQ